MYIYLDKQGVVKEIINDEALRQSASNVNEIYVYYDGLQENDVGSVLATYRLPDGTITDEMQVATQTQESEIPYDAERDLKYFQYYKAYAFYHFAIADLALSQEGVVRLMVRLAQKDGEYIKVAGLVCFDVEGELVKEDHGVSLAQYNYLVKAWYETKECLPLDGSKAMQGNLDMGAHNVLLNGKTLKDNNGALNYNGSDLAKQSDTSSLQSQIDTINATQNVVDIVGTKAELNAYVTKDLHTNDKIEVLADESQNNANTIYEWNGNSWSLVGSKAPYYSKAESDARYNELKAKSYEKDTTSYVTGHVPDSSLVTKSLDGLNEKIETNKIQTDTNSSDIALLESNAIKKETDASLKSLTLPSAKDLRTKDGTSFGGGSKLYNGTEYLPTFDIATLKDTYVDLSTNQTIHGIKTIIPNNAKKCGFKFMQGNYSSTGEISLIHGIGNNGSESGCLIFSNYGSYYSVALAGVNFTDTSVGVGTTIRLNSITADAPNAIYMQVRAGAGIQMNAGSNRLQLWGQNKNTDHPLQLSKDYGSTFSNILTDADLHHYYRHTVLISEPTNKTAYLAFTAESEKNITIDSIQDLIAVFGHTSIACSGLFRDGDPANSQSLLMINVGTSISDTTISAATIENNSITDFSNASFSDTFGSAGFTITDNVTPM